MVKVKICGITNAEDALKACEYGADLIGFVFVEGTPRHVTEETVKTIVKALPQAARARTELVGLFKDAPAGAAEKVIKECGLDSAQLHGEETPEYCVALKKAIDDVKIIKVFKVKKGIMPCGVFETGDYGAADHFLFDAYQPDASGGTGKVFDWPSIKRHSADLDKPFFVAGGLTPANVADAVRAMHPYGVDVSSGVESAPGKKDALLMKEFIQNAKKR